MMIRIVHLALLPLIVVGWVAPAAAAIVRFRERATISAPVVHLGDVAEVADADAERTNRLESITLSPAPPPGGESRLEFVAMRARLRAHGVDLSGIEFSGSSSVLVSSSVNRPATEAARTHPQTVISDWQHRRAETMVVEKMQQYIANKNPQLGRTNVEVRLDRASVPALLANASSGFDIGGGTPPWERWQTFVMHSKERKPGVAEISVTCRVHPKPSVLAARYALPRGHVLSEADLVWRQVDRTEGLIDRMQDAVGRETTKPLHPDDPIVLSAIRAVPLIRSNDIVTVYARQPGVTVKRLMKARDDGSAGDQVTLVTLDGRQQIMARVTGYHEAEAIGSNRKSAPQVRFEAARADSTSASAKLSRRRHARVRANRVSEDSGLRHAADAPRRGER